MRAQNKRPTRGQPGGPEHATHAPNMGSLSGSRSNVVPVVASGVPSRHKNETKRAVVTYIRPLHLFPVMASAFCGGA